MQLSDDDKLGIGNVFWFVHSIMGEENAIKYMSKIRTLENEDYFQVIKSIKLSNKRNYSIEMTRDQLMKGIIQESIAFKKKLNLMMTEWNICRNG